MAPRHRLDHLASFVETHGERLSHFIEALTAYQGRFTRFKFRSMSIGFIVAIISGAMVEIGLSAWGGLSSLDNIMMHATGGIGFIIIFFLWITYTRTMGYRRFRKRQQKHLDDLTPLDSQTRRDSWEAIRNMVSRYIDKTAGQFSKRDLKQEDASVRLVFERGAREIREALNELAAIHHDDAAEVDRWIAKQSSILQKGK
jgi:hypothetical protein